ncbi:MAG: GAF domain-containing protein [Comamonadaceae bacterium]|nr:GAF domain-containing protein [Comamonadaceae bacterium]
MKPTEALALETRSQWYVLWSALLVAGMGLGGMIYYDRLRVARDATAALTLRSTAAAADLQRRLESINTALNGIRRDAPFFTTGKQGLEIANRQLKALTDALEGVRTLALFDAAGTMIASNRADIVNQNFAERDYFQVPLKDKNPSRLYVSAPFKTVLGVYSVVVAKITLGVDEKFSGIVTATLDPEDFRRTLEGMRDAPDSFTGMAHASGQVFLSAPKAEADSTSDIANIDSFLENHQKSGLQTSTSTGFNATTQARRMVAMTTVHPTSLAMDNSLSIFVSRDLESIFEQWRTRAFFVAGIFLALALLSAQSLRLYQRRLRDLKQTAHHAAQGREQAEQKALATTQLMQSFLDHLPGMAYVKDSDCRVLMANRGFKLIGLDPATMIGRNNLELLPGPLGEKATEDDLRVLAHGKIELIQEELAGHFFDTSKFVIDDTNGQRLLAGITLDVTARQRHVQLMQALLNINEIGSQLGEKELLTQGLEFAEQLTTSGIGFLHFVNEDQETLELVTWTSNALKGCTAVHDAHYPISQAGIWADCFRHKRPVVFNNYADYTHKHGLPDGHAPLLRLISVPVIENGAVRMMIGVGNKPSDYNDLDTETVQLIGNDLWRIARRNRAEKQLQQQLIALVETNTKLTDTQSQLMQSEKLAAIGQLAAGIAHEINNPVGFVYSNLSTMAEYAEDLLTIDNAYSESEDQLQRVAPQLLARVHALKAACDHPFVVTDLRHLLRESVEGLERVKTIVQDLKDFSRSGDTGWEWADLQKGLESTLNIVRNEIKYKADIVREWAPLPAVRCIPAQINQVFMNLLVNAAQSIEEHGTIVLRSGVDGDSVWVAVQDNGCGIASDKMSRIFDPFYTSKPVGKGTGLGLTMVWSIVQRHQGSIDVQSTVGQGSCFTLRLPINGPLNEPKNEGPAPQ